MEIGVDVFIKSGISKNQINQLIEYSRSDPSIIEFTSDPVRFKNKESFNNWYQQGRTIYTLIDKQNNLLGIIWFGQKTLPDLPEYNYTFAIRIYDRARGQGLSYQFMKFTFNDLFSKEKQITGFWLETSANNIAAIKTYKKFGFKPIDYSDDQSKIYMTRRI
jgi:RimJ/RimL family protein N-acetyltransferase